MEHLPGDRLLTHTNFNRAEMLDVFKKSQRPLVLVSPSMDRGVDLPGDECRAIIIAKVPYPDLGDPQVNKRVYASTDGNRWYAHKAVSKIIQMAGRGVRSETDYASTYILDEQFDRLYTQYKGMFPPWFKEAIVK
jgi:Rad3-related DNA helicase